MGPPLGEAETCGWGGTVGWVREGKVFVARERLDVEVGRRRLVGEILKCNVCE